MLVKILSGLPGSGKSHRANLYKTDLVVGKRVEVVSADNYHIGEDGKYRFDPKKVGWAHDQCLLEFISHLRDGSVGMIVVDNTNTAAWEIAPYLRIAQVWGHVVDIVRIWCDPFKAHARNVHGVPIERIMDMHRRMLEPLPAHWPVLHYTSEH